MDEQNTGLEYAQMLEIPVSTVNVVKKRSLFSRKSKPQEDLKDSVIGSVNRRMDEDNTAALQYASGSDAGGYVQTEDLTAFNKPRAKKVKQKESKGGTAGKIILAEAVAACLIAAGIFVTNIFVPNTAINAFMGNINKPATKEANYTDFKLTPVTSELSETAVSVTPEGVIYFQGVTNVYPVCDGEIASITQNDGAYTVKIAHTSKFTSVVTGLDNVYYTVGDDLKGNLPFAHTDGKKQVQVSMYDGENMLNCYTLSGVVPVWNS